MFGVEDGGRQKQKHSRNTPICTKHQVIQSDNFIPFLEVTNNL